MSSIRIAAARSAGALWMAAVLSLAACGGDPESGPAATPRSNPTSGATARPKTVRASAVAAPDPGPATDRFPVSVEHAFGTTVVPEEPLRVLALSTFDLDTTFALGLTPLSPRAKDDPTLEQVNAWADYSTQGAVTAFWNSTARPDLAKVAAAQPDLILNVSTITSPEEYAELSKIAPTVVERDQSGKVGRTWQERTTVVGRALGRSGRAEALIADLEGRIAAVAADNPAFAGKTAVALEYHGPDRPLGSGNPSIGTGGLLSALGFEVLDPPSDLTPRSLGEADVDLVVWDAGARSSGRADVEADQRLQALDVMKEDRVVYLEGEVASAILHESAVSLRFVLGSITPRLREASSKK